MSSNDMSPFILVDGSSYLHRAFHALPPLMTSKGQPTGAIYGVVSMLKRLMHDYSAKNIVVIFDAKGKNFRHELFAGYKAHRPPMHDDLVAQVEPLHQLIKAMGLPLVVLEGFEADDVIATLTQQALAANRTVVISTGDKDLTQLVNPRVTLINTMSNTILDEKGVEKKFGVPPSMMRDYLALVGDDSDNIPGVPGVGPKTAVKWLQTYGSLAEVVLHADEMAGKVGESLRASLSQLPLSKELVTLRQDLVLPVSYSDLLENHEDLEKLKYWYTQLEFKNWLKELESPVQAGEHAVKIINGHYRILLDKKEFLDYVEQLKHSSLFSVDTETTSLNYMDASVVGISFALKPEDAVYIPLLHEGSDVPKQLDRAFVFQTLKPILENPDIKKLGHNLKYDKEVLANEGIDLQGIFFDTMLESYVVDSTATRHDLVSLCLQYLGLRKTPYEEVAGKGAKQIPFAQVPVEQAGHYSAMDADYAFRLHENLWPKIEGDEKLKSVLLGVEMPLLSVLVEMERRGVLVEVDVLKKQSEELALRLATLEKEAFQLAGTVFNLDSPKQLQEILYQKLKIQPLKKTPTGQYSTAEAVLEELSHQYPLPAVILQYRSLNKLKSTYTEALPEQVNPKTGRVHTSYQQAVTSTGRLSSTDPNLQNIPIRTEEGRRIRAAFIAPNGFKILSADYSQIELRLVACVSKDPGLIDDFKKGLDIHRATASKIFGIPVEAVTDTQRRQAKTINFGLMYGMSAYGLAQRLGVERSLAQAYIDAYFLKYPGIPAYMEEARKTARRQGFVETLLGRRLYIPDIHSKNKLRQNAAERIAINGPLQGTAADIIKKAMIMVHDWLKASKFPAHLIMQVHDELVFEVKEGYENTLTEKVKVLMGQAASLCIPLIVDVGVGKNWDEAH